MRARAAFGNRCLLCIGHERTSQKVTFIDESPRCAREARSGRAVTCAMARAVLGRQAHVRLPPWCSMEQRRVKASQIASAQPMLTMGGIERDQTRGAQS